MVTFLWKNDLKCMSLFIMVTDAGTTDRPGNYRLFFIRGGRYHFCGGLMKACLLKCVGTKK